MLIEIQENMELARKALDVVKSRYLLCILVAQRIHQLEKGAQPTIDALPDEYSSPKTYFNLAMKEIIEGNMDLEQVSTEE
ncbi:MAG: DNA-directed RNA polymerase subunit omega [Nitrospinaceae bacterium]